MRLWGQTDTNPYVSNTNPTPPTEWVTNKTGIIHMT